MKKRMCNHGAITINRASSACRVFIPPAKYCIYTPQTSLIPIGGTYSEKHNGVFAQWNGAEFVSKEGNVFAVPEFFKASMQKGDVLNGEIFLGYGKFNLVLKAVKNADDANWQHITFNIFDDAKAQTVHYVERMARLADLTFPAHVTVLKPILIESIEQLTAAFNDVVARGGEGLVIRKGNFFYKYKHRPDAEAVVIDTIAGKGKNEGFIGSLVCEFNGKTFRLPVSVSAQQGVRVWIGKKVTFSYLELTVNGLPSQASFVGVRDYE